MCWFKKKEERVEETQNTEKQVSSGSVFLTALKDSPSDIKQDEVDAYWVLGNPAAWQPSLWYLVASYHQFGTTICKGKLRRTLKHYEYGWSAINQEPIGEYSVVADESVFEIIKDVYCWIDTQEEWKSISDNRDYKEVFVPKKIVAMLKGKYSESFSLLLASKSLMSRDLIQKAITLYEEGLSPDMRAYLLLVENENERTG